MTVDVNGTMQTYLGNAGLTYSDAQLEGAMAAERGLQAACCRVPADDDDSDAAAAARVVLDEALCRRIAVNLARRGLPLGMQMSDAGAARFSTNDPEVRRLEGPFRKLVLG